MALGYQWKCWSAKRNCRVLAAACCRFSFLILPIFLFFFFFLEKYRISRNAVSFFRCCIKYTKKITSALTFLLGIFSQQFLYPLCSLMQFLTLLSLMLCSANWLALTTFSPSFLLAFLFLFFASYCYIFL